MAFIELPGVRLFYTDDPPESALDGDTFLAAPTLLVHGLWGNSDSWAHQIPWLRRRCRTVAVDLRGHGRSEAPESDYTTAELANDLAALIRSLDIAPAVVVGQSMGGSVAAVLAVRYPELVRALVMVDPDYAGEPRDRGRMLDLADALEGPDGETAALEMIRSRMFVADTPAGVRERVLRTVFWTAPAVRSRAFRQNAFAPGSIRFRPAADAVLAQRTQPVLAFHRDPARAEVEETTARHPASRVLRLPDSGHVINEEHPDFVNTELDKWLAGIS